VCEAANLSNNSPTATQLH